MLAPIFLATLTLSCLVRDAVAVPLESRAQNSKKGICFNDIKEVNALGGAISWAYNWDSVGPGLPGGVAYYPMLWSNAADHTNGWTMTPAQAVSAWKQYLQPYAGRVTLVSPAITNGGASWMTAFLNQCTGCTIDVVATHWYDTATNIQYFKNYLTDLHNSTGKDIWLTEFMGTGSTAQQQTFLKNVLPWMDQQPWLLKYAAFGVSGQFANILVDTTGNVTPLGATYYNTN
ncbi:hypothetical protein RQP46_009496 [Phenoliferia psychrophenolica]